MSQSQTGTTFENAIVIQAPHEGAGVAAIYRYLDRRFGVRGSRSGWELRAQRLHEVDGRHYDEMEIAVGGEIKIVFFDIESFFGK